MDTAVSSQDHQHIARRTFTIYHYA